MPDRIGFDPTSRTIARRPLPWAAISIGLGWAFMISFAAIVAHGVTP